MIKVLFLCTGNSARSILAEYLLKHLDTRFDTYSAGADPTGEVNPWALKTLERYGIATEGAASKPLDLFLDQQFDVVITVCDHARDACSVFPAARYRAHWSSPDPAAVVGDDGAKMAAFERVAQQITKRLQQFCRLPWGDESDSQMLNSLNSIGKVA